MPLLTTSLALMMLAGTVAETAAETHCSGQEANLATYLEMTEVLFNKRTPNRAADYYAPEFITHNVDEGGLGTKTVQPKFMDAMWANLQKIEPDRKLVNNVIVCKDDLVIAQVTTSGSRAGETLIDKPEGRRRYKTSAMDIYRFKDGKVVERWGNNDMVAKSRQLGMALDLSPTPLPPE